MSYKIKLLVLGPVATNTYIFYNDESKEAVVIDPAAKADIISAFLDEEKLSLKAILLTHAHFDHIGAAEELRNKYNAKVYAHEAEQSVALDSAVNLSASMGRESLSLKFDRQLRDNEELELLGTIIKVFHTPGHTVGGVCYFIPSENILFSGDTLFSCSVGRTDFPGGSSADLIRSIKERLFVLPDDTKVFSGHGEQTTIEYEKAYNPFVV